MSQIGFVYLLTNDYMPDVYKVGCTERSPHERAVELSKGSGVPYPFKVLCYIEVHEFQRVEKEFHGWLSEHRISDQREFFHDGIEFAIRLMWWYPKRLSFCEPLVAGDAGMLMDGDWFGDATHFMETKNPWEKSSAPTDDFDITDSVI